MGNRRLTPRRKNAKDGMGELSGRADGAGDSRDDWPLASGEIVLPNPQDAPTHFAQFAVYATIPGTVCGELLSPEGAVVCRPPAMARAAVPETAVHEDGEALAAEDEIRLAEHGLMATPAGDSGGAEQAGEGDFGRLVSARADAGHYLGALGPGEDVRHGTFTSASWRVNLLLR